MNNEPLQNEMVPAARLKSLAQSRGFSMNKLVEQLSAHALATWDTENRSGSAYLNSFTPRDKETAGWLN